MGTAIDRDLADLLGAVAADGLMAHTEELARWSRHAGTEGERRGLSYLDGQLRGHGFATEVIVHDAYISLPVSGSVAWSGGDVAGISHSFSRTTGPEGTSGPLVAVGAGLPDDYREVEAEGAVVLVDGIATPAAALEAGRRGAVAQVHVSPDDRLHEMCISPVWGSPSDAELHRLPRTAVVSIPRAGGRLLADALRSGPLVVTVRAEVETGWRKTPILVAEAGSAAGGAAEPFVLFTGHHDTWHRGAMDNGAANATMVEVARLCAGRRRAWRRGLRLVFWSGHSQGRYSSSAWYADHHWQDLDARALVHVNIDSTGGRGNTVVSGATASAELGALAEEALQSQAGQHWLGRRMHRAGDQSFWGIGIPSIFGNMGEQPVEGTDEAGAGLSGGARLQGTGWWWHTPEDTADKIDPEILVRDTRIYLHVVWRLLTSPVLPLDHLASTGAMLEALRRMQQRVGSRFDLSALIEGAEGIVAKLTSLQPRWQRDGGAGGTALANETLVALSRILVPVDYTAGHRFAHDPALPSAPIPALADVWRLAEHEPGSDDFLFLETRLARARNQVQAALRDADRALDRVLGS